MVRRMPNMGVLALAGMVPVLAAMDVGAQPQDNSYIVVLHDETPNVPAVAGEHARAFGLAVSHIYGHALRGYAAVIPAARLAAIRDDPRVAFISDDRPVRAVKGKPPSGGGGTQPPEALPTGVDRVGADQRAGFGQNGGPAVAVIDTGSGPHGDLNIAGGQNCTTGRNYNDGNGHGTHVAGTVGAVNNDVGVVGVMPGVPIYSVRVLNSAGSGSWSSVICGIDWVAANAASRNIRVANMSLSGAGSDDRNCGNTNNDALHRSICSATAAGVLFVVAAGNDGADFAGSVPAAYDEVLTVTAVADFDGKAGGGAAATCRSGVDDTPADFSNYTTAGGADTGHTIAAPGVCILSTWKDGGYDTISGTSMAAPHVAGAAAAYIASTTDPELATPAAVMSRLRADAAASGGNGFAGDPSSPFGARHYGYMLDARGY